MSHLARKYLPGCYRNIPCEDGESLPGYLLRLAEANGYSGIRDFLRVAAAPRANSIRTQLMKIRADAALLARIGQIAVGDPAHLRHFESEPLPADPALGPIEALFFQECRVDVDALYPKRTPVCPACLAERGVAREEWDLAPVTVCSTHGTLLMDECPGCHTGLHWSRSRLLSCDSCGADLREATPPLASPGAREVSLHFQVLAPFRVVVHSGRRIVYWDEMFHVFKALLLPDWAWAAADYPQVFVAETSVAERHAMIDRLAGALAGAQYDMRSLRGKAERALTPLAALPVPGVREQVAVEYLAINADLSREVAAALACEEEPRDPPSAAELFSGKPPSLRTYEDIQRFLDAGPAEVSRLLELGVIAPMAKAQIGYDADDLLRARHVLASLLSTEPLSQLAGVAILEVDLRPDGLLPRWNRHSRSDARVMPQIVIDIQRQLIARWHQATAPDSGISLDELAQGVDHPFELVSAAIKGIVGGSIQRFSWRAPYRWCDLVVGIDDAVHLRPGKV